MSNPIAYRNVPDMPEGNVMKTELTVEERALQKAIMELTWRCNSIQHKRSIPEINTEFNTRYQELKDMVATCKHSVFLLSGAMHHMSKYCAMCGQRIGWTVMIESATLVQQVAA